jgi:type VI secretion system protein ImpJ
MPEFALDDGPQATLARWVAQDALLEDNVLAHTGSAADTKLGRLNLRLLAEGEPRDAYVCLGMVRVVEKRSNGQVALDPKYIAPVLDIAAQPVLVEYLTEIRNLVRHRADALAGRLNQASQNDFGQVQELLALQVANRFDPLLTHLLARPTLHPEALYTTLLQLAGELATFMDSRKRRARAYGDYRHDDLLGSFEPLMTDLRDLLADMIDPKAVRIALVERAKGLYLGAVPDLELLRTAKFVLAVKAHVDGESLRQRLPRELKIGPPEKIKEISNLALSGITPRPLPMAPPRMPYFADFVYFELDRQSEFWKNLETTRTIVLHFSGEFPGLQLEMWALRP